MPIDWNVTDEDVLAARAGRANEVGASALRLPAPYDPEFEKLSLPEKLDRASHAALDFKMALITSTDPTSSDVPRIKAALSAAQSVLLQKVRVDETAMRQHSEGSQEEVRQRVHAEVARLLAEQYTQGISRMRGILGGVSTEQLELALQFDADITNEQLGIVPGRDMYTIEAERRKQMRAILQGQAPVPAEHKAHPYAVKYLRRSKPAIEARAVEIDQPAVITAAVELAPPAPAASPPIAGPNNTPRYDAPTPPTKAAADKWLAEPVPKAPLS